MQDEINKLREQLAQSRQRSRQWYTHLRDLRKLQRQYDKTKEMAVYVTKQHYEDFVDGLIENTEALIARVEAKDQKPP